MKLKKIFASFASIAIAATAFSGVAMATNSHGAPELIPSVTYPFEMEGMELLAVNVGYTGFTGFSSYSALSKKGVGINSVLTTLNYDNTALTYVATVDGSAFAEGTGGNEAPGISYGWTATNIKNVPSTDSYMIALFTVNDGVDFTKQKIEFSFDKIEFGVASVVGGKVSGDPELYGNTAACTDTVKAEKFYYGSEAPATTTYTVTATADVEVTGDISAPVAEGTKITVAPKAKEGYTAKLLANGTEIAAGEYTVTSNVNFAVDYAPKHEYTLDDKGTCLKDSIKGIYYSLSVKNVADKLAIKVSDKTFEAKGVPTVEGAALAQMTYAIFQVPDEIYNNVPAITAVTSGETVYSVAE